MKRIERLEKILENINVRITSVNESNIRKIKKMGLTLALVGSLSGCTATVLYLYNDTGVESTNDKTDDSNIIDDIIDNILDNDDDEVNPDDSIIKDENEVINIDASNNKDKEGSLINDIKDNKEDNKIDEKSNATSNNHNSYNNNTNPTHKHSFSDWTYLDDEYEHRSCSNCNHEEKREHKWSVTGYNKETGMIEETCTTCEHKKVSKHTEHTYGEFKYNSKSGNEVANCSICGLATYRNCDMTNWSVSGNTEERHCKHGCGHKETRAHEHMHSVSSTPSIGTIYGTADKCHQEYYTCTSKDCPDGGKVNVRDVGHTYGNTYEIDVGRNTFHQYQDCTVCGYKKYLGAVTHTATSPSTPVTPGQSGNTGGSSSSGGASNPSTPSTPTPTPEPSVPDTPSTPTPTPEPSAPDTPSTPEPTPIVPDTPSTPSTPSEYVPSTPSQIMPDAENPFDTSMLKNLKNSLLSAYNKSDLDDSNQKGRQA